MASALEITEGSQEEPNPPFSFSSSGFTVAVEHECACVSKSKFTTQISDFGDSGFANTSANRIWRCRGFEGLIVVS